mgnify:FL=1
MAVNLESIRRAYAGKYNVKGDVGRDLSIKYLNQVPGAIQQLAKEEELRKEKYYEQSPDLEPFKGYDSESRDFVLSKKKEWDAAAKALSKRGVSEEEALELTQKQNQIENALQTFKDDTDFALGFRKQIIEAGNNIHPLTTDENRIIFDRFVTNEYMSNRVIDPDTGKSKWGPRVEEDENGNKQISYDIEDIYSFKDGVPKVSESNKKAQVANEEKLMKFAIQEEGRGFSRDVSEQNIRNLTNTLYSKTGVWTGQYIDNFVEDTYVKSFEPEFLETNLGKQIQKKDPMFFNKLSQIEDQETATSYMKNMLRKVDIKEDWVNFNTNVRMQTWDAIRADKESMQTAENVEQSEKTPTQIRVAEEKQRKKIQSITRQLNTLDEDPTQPNIDLGNGFTAYRYEGNFVVIPSNKTFVYNQDNPPPSSMVFNSTNAIRKKYGVDVKLP